MTSNKQPTHAQELHELELVLSGLNISQPPTEETGREETDCWKRRNWKKKKKKKMYHYNEDCCVRQGWLLSKHFMRVLLYV